MLAAAKAPYVDLYARASTSFQAPLVEFDDSEFISPELCEHYDDAEYRRVMYKSTQKNNKMLRLLLGVFRKIMPCYISEPRVEERQPMDTAEDVRGFADDEMTYSSETDVLHTSGDDEGDTEFSDSLLPGDLF